MDWSLADFTKIANLGGLLAVVWYLLRYTIPGIVKANKQELLEVHAQHSSSETAKESIFLQTMQMVLAESKRATDAICARMERMETIQAKHTKTLAAIVTTLDCQPSPEIEERKEREEVATDGHGLCGRGDLLPADPDLGECDPPDNIPASSAAALLAGETGIGGAIFADHPG